MVALLTALAATATKAHAQDQSGAATTAASGAGTAPAGTVPQSGALPGPAQGLPTLPAPGTVTAAPPVGVSVRLGDVNSAIAAANAVGGVLLTRPAGLTFTPTLGLSEEFNDNVFDTTTGRRADLITAVTPGILINLSTPSASGTLSYAPSLQIYAENSSQNDVVQRLNGSLQATLLPRTLLLSLNAYASQQTTSGGVAPGGIGTSPSGNRTTTTSFAVRPTFEHRFGDFGTLQIGYALQYSDQSGRAATAPGATQPFFVGSHAVANEGSASFTTGSVLGRFNDTMEATASVESGSGVLGGAHQYVATNTFRVAVQRRVYVFGTLGYEDIFYPSVPKVQIRDGVWAVGFNLTPGPATSITAGYGRLEGFDSPFVRATVGVTARTSLVVSYSDTLGSSLQFLQSALTNTIVDAAGNPIDNQTGAPVLLTNQLLSVQSSVVRNAVFSSSLITTWPRDTVSLSLLNQQQKLIANASGVSGFSQNSWSGSIAWTHSLTPLLTAASYVQLGETNSRAVGSGSSTVLAGQLSLVYRLTPTLSGSAIYGVTNRSLTGRSALQNIVIVALQKTF